MLHPRRYADGLSQIEGSRYARPGHPGLYSSAWGHAEHYNRLCPLLDPALEFREGRTRARLREDVRIRRFALVATCGWGEMGNFGMVVRVVEELAKDAGVEFAGAVLRPHAWLMKEEEELTEEGKAVLNAARRAGSELAKEGKMNRETLDAVSRPLVSQKEFWRRYNAS